MVVASFTDVTKQYEVTLEHDKTVDCTCLDRHYCKQRNPGHTCKHMSNAQTQVDAEVERAATFLALKRQVEAQERERRENAACYMRMMYSEF